MKKLRWFAITLFLLSVVLYALDQNQIRRKTDQTIPKISMDQEEIQTLQNAITRSVTTCYTLEGSYPQSLGYLKKHYGLHYDENKYFVDYQPLGANIMPDITIIRKEADHR